jgi:glycopeptide antibiotics resistance protein
MVMPIILNAFILGSLFAVLGFWFDRWVVKHEFARGSIISMLILDYSAVLIKSIWFSEISWWVYAPLVIFVITIGIHGPDLWTTMMRGRGWWKSKE